MWAILRNLRLLCSTCYPSFFWSFRYKYYYFFCVFYSYFTSDQAIISMFQSICASVPICPSHLFDYDAIIVSSWNFQDLLPSDVHAKGQRQRSKVKFIEVKTQLSHFRTITPVWIHIWWWNDAQSLMLLRKGARQISRSHGTKKIRQFWPELSVSGLQL